MPNKILPPPSWHGSPGNLLPLYVSFLKRHSDMYGQQQLNSMKESIAITETLFQALKIAVETETRVIKEYENAILTLQSQIVPFTDEHLLSEAYQSLMEIPEVIGTRVDANGALVVLLRPRPDGLDFGDFELNFSLVKELEAQTNNVRIVANRLPSMTKMDYGQMRRGATDSDGLTLFTIHRTTDIQSFKSMLKEARLDDIVKEILDHFWILAKYRVNQTQADPAEEPEPTWEGYVFNPVSAIAKRLEISANAATKQQIRQHEGMLAIRQSERLTTIGHMRAAQSKLRPLKAELEKAIRTFEQRSTQIDTLQAAEELKFITTGIPGVMGIRFENDGTLVVHVRSSHQRGDNRYDMGDYELIMDPHPYESLGVIRMQRTRPPLGSNPLASTLYWHHDPTYKWFCYGSRSTEMKELFTNGNFTQFTNIAVNTLNAINAGDWLYLGNFPQIPVEEVWINRPRNRARRPVLVNA